MSLPDFRDLKEQHKSVYRPYRINNSALHRRHPVGAEDASIAMGVAIDGNNPALAKDMDPDKGDCCTMNTTGV
jgi:hypothetical protein